MKYVFVSDVHGQYDALIDALNGANFNSATDTLVSLGDLFDRGPASKEVLEYVMGLPHFIAVWGNHDRRLRELVLDLDIVHLYDVSNGVLQTINSFTQKQFTSLWVAQSIFNTDSEYQPMRELLRKYFKKCVWAVEFPNLIGVHGWLPSDDASNIIPFSKASKYDWEDAVWANTEGAIKAGKFPSKDLIIGHWHAWRIAEKFGNEQRKTMQGDFVSAINCDSFELATPTNCIICIDGCSNYPKGGKVNTFTYISDCEPKLIK